MFGKGINDYTGTLRGLMSNSLFDQDQIVGGNLHNMLSGLVDVNNERKTFFFISAKFEYFINIYSYIIEYFAPHINNSNVYFLARNISVHIYRQPILCS